ncbi:membrane protein [Methanobrevibacter sp. YE315]|uniref:phage holin family protein n=1 Tax=Methanobrevibacter sp. YE315 TaxID=1609968 RepID=UPI000764D94A|nr:phage holin family protein [Methanobrevibacter sp. YE315]AMD17202.1 membrane protein [Methanobrevibacter sp. YE315]
MRDIDELKKTPGLSLKSYLIMFIANVIGLYLISFGLDFTINKLGEVVLFVFFISIFNVVLWPLIIKVYMPVLVWTFGIGTLILNGGIFAFFGPLFGLNITGWGIILAPLTIALITIVLSSLFGIEDDRAYYQAVLREAQRKRKGNIKDYPGLIIVEIDGLAYDVLCEAVDKGIMPTVKSMMDGKTHTLKKWETDLSSQTGASQAGILHGNNEDITAFRWVEKENDNQMMQCSGVTKVKIIEERVSDGNGLLVENGASRSNLFSGDTDNVIFTFSKITDLRKLYNGAWFSVFSNPSEFARIVVLVVEDMVHEIHSQLKHRLLNIQPRISRGIKYVPVRAGTNVFMREINTGTLIGDMMIGDIDVAYSTYLGYDEIAHHSGVRDDDAWFALKGMDRQIKRLLDGNKYSPREYQFVIQSDHGQTNGATFTQRYGESFEDFVKSLLPQDLSMYANMSSNEDHFAEVYIPFSDKIDNIRNRNKEDEEKVLSESEVIVLASGNLALIYLTQWDHRLTYEEINSLFPELINEIVNNEYIGFILVRSSERGDMVIAKNGTYYLDDDEIEGKNPLEDFGDNIVHHLKRNSSFKYTPDILVNSFYDAENDEVCAFEELVGSHGGVGGSQSEPFILYPSDWNVPDEEIVGAENIYRVLKTNLENIKESSKINK